MPHGAGRATRLTYSPPSNQKGDADIYWFINEESTLAVQDQHGERSSVKGFYFLPIIGQPNPLLMRNMHEKMLNPLMKY